ncbi:uncharacterized protein LOC110851631 isoform X2 [Folsomia candida]|uniref:uncharacterized protein LOC110851631 isoform X2 n=1 Tax=Folsomia candida TaxID=158441 RepID=UPI000B8F43EA|nr:uncharacterized protein LOC110851631 isoform X2 [Folsomia candida]
MADTQKDFVQKLIAQSKTLTQANVKKCENERILKELTLFQNLSSFCKVKNNSQSDSKSSNHILDKVFKVTVSVFPSPLRLDAVRSNETMRLVVENVSKNFSFSPTHWQFVVDVNSNVSSWSLDSNFDPGTSQSFSSCFYTSATIAPVELRLRVVFTLNHQGRSFAKTLDIYRTAIDILHMLTPMRYLRTEMLDPSGALDPLVPFNLLNPSTSNNKPARNKTATPRLESADEEDEEIPAVTQFFFKLCPPLLKSFPRQILLKDAKPRWLTMSSEADFTTLISATDPTFAMYYLEDEILVSSKSSSGTVAFKCSNPKILCALKIAILTRLMKLDGIRIVCPSDVMCEKLYALKLRLEMVSRPELEEDVRVRDLVDFYLDLRDVSENVEFSSSSTDTIKDREIEVIDL